MERTKVKEKYYRELSTIVVSVQLHAISPLGVFTDEIFQL
jgi:hypothetical protein